MSDYIAARRIENLVTDTARKNGIIGDPFAEVTALGGLRSELTIVALLSELPRDIRRDPLAESLVRSVVLSGREKVVA